ncbi:putative Fibronectin type-III domain-containing protein [Seiridium cardinale]|uniref:Fibronectin type-III domain-containing protein n=1 Tax=Seiridium cardinale TaxID=138064 RepID=A0ABR2XW22_9PEZI
MAIPRFLGAAAFLAMSVRGCIQAHIYYYGDVKTGDAMTMSVWVNDHLVCKYTDRIWVSTDDSVFCARNSDGEGEGCSDGYTFCVHNYGKDEGGGVFSFYENEELAYTTDLTASDYEVSKDDSCLCTDNDDGTETCASCAIYEAVLTSTQPCDNLVQVETCDFKAFCETPGLSDGDFDPPNPFPYLPFTLMVVGDSISHGMEADWTWRYRLWEWMTTLGYDVKFVGPYSGTHGPNPPSSAVPSPPLLPGESTTADSAITGLYADGVSVQFSYAEGHGAWWGRQAMQVKETINDWVYELQPDYVLVLLGFNDLGWFVSDPDGLLDSMTTLITNARAGKNDVKLLIGNVVQRLFIEGRQDLVDNTNAYNLDLIGKVEALSSPTSPASYVDVEANYYCQPQICPDGYDGLHPNAQGEFHIAQAFANVLRDSHDMVGQDFSLPATIPTRDISTPTGFLVEAVPEGLFATWSQVEEARGYNTRLRVQGMTDWWSEGAVYPNTWASYFTWCLAGQVWEFQVQTKGDGDATSDWTSILSATCDPQTSQGPPNIVVEPYGDDGITLSWGPVTTGYSVNRYEPIIWDQDTEGAFINAQATTGTSYTYTGLVSGHHYATWVATWVDLPDGNIAGGLPASGRQVLVGAGSPPLPTGLSVSNIDPTTVQLTWTGSSSAGGYAIYYQSLLNSSLSGEDGTTSGTSYEIGFLFPGTWHYEFCVTAFNGNLESACTDWASPPVYPGYEKRGELETNGTTDVHLSTENNVTTVFYDGSLQNLYGLWATNLTSLVG